MLSRQVYCVGVLILFLGKLEVGFCSGVKCYSCSSKDNEACIKPDRNQLPMVKCGMNTLTTIRNHARDINERYDKIFEVDAIDAGRIDLVCLKAVIKDGNKDYIIRGCQLAEQRNLDICNKLKEKDTNLLKTVHCSKCSTDGCNAGEMIRFDVVLAALMTFILRLYI